MNEAEIEGNAVLLRGILLLPPVQCCQRCDAIDGEACIRQNQRDPQCCSLQSTN